MLAKRTAAAARVAHFAVAVAALAFSDIADAFRRLFSSLLIPPFLAFLAKAFASSCPLGGSKNLFRSILHQRLSLDIFLRATNTTSAAPSKQHCRHHVPMDCVNKHTLRECGLGMPVSIPSHKFIDNCMLCVYDCKLSAAKADCAAACVSNGWLACTFLVAIKSGLCGQQERSTHVLSRATVHLLHHAVLAAKSSDKRQALQAVCQINILIQSTMRCLARKRVCRPGCLASYRGASPAAIASNASNASKNHTFHLLIWAACNRSAQLAWRRCASCLCKGSYTKRKQRLQDLTAGAGVEFSLVLAYELINFERSERTITASRSPAVRPCKQERQWLAAWCSAQRLPACYNKLCARCSCAARVIIALAGVPGSGKSTIAVEVCNQLNAALGRPLAVVVPMDGAVYSCETYCRGTWVSRGRPANCG